MNQPSIFLFFLLATCLLSCSTELQIVDQTATSFYQHLKQGEFIAIKPMIYKEVLKQSPWEQWEKAFKENQKEYGAIKSFSCDGTKYSNDNQGLRYQLRYKVEYEERSKVEEVVLLKVDGTYKLVHYQFAPNSKNTNMKKTEEDWKKELSDLEYHVLREAGTERPFTGEYYKHDAEGTYHCRACNRALFESKHKYHSGCGWPSFWSELESANITQRLDKSHGMNRLELVCSNCESHLGHIFNDGPPPTGVRYCINSVSLRFEPK